MKFITSITTLLVAASVANAQVVVIDPTAIAHNQVNHIRCMPILPEFISNTKYANPSPSMTWACTGCV